MNAPGSPQPDPLLEVFIALRAALAPFGIGVGRPVLQLWQEAQERGTAIFVGSGEFDPVRVGVPLCTSMPHPQLRRCVS